MTGYQLHVRTFTLHTVLKTVADSYKPPNPPSVDVRPEKLSPSASTSSSTTAADGAAAGCIAPVADAAVAMDVDGEGAASTAAAATVIAAVAPAVSSSLVKPPFDACIPEVVELLMEDLFGESAAAKEVGFVLNNPFVFLYVSQGRGKPRLHTNTLGRLGRGRHLRCGSHWGAGRLQHSCNLSRQVWVLAMLGPIPIPSCHENILS